MIELNEYELDDSEDFPKKNTKRSLRRARGKKKKRKLINATSDRWIGFVWSDDKGNYLTLPTTKVGGFSGQRPPPQKVLHGLTER